MFDEPYSGKLYMGKFKGYVRQNNDEENRGRLRCFCPQVMGEQDDAQHWLDWAQPCLPWIGGLNTLDFGPPLTNVQRGGKETIVWIEFEGGQVDHPIWVGTVLPAPTIDDVDAQLDLTNAAGASGGDIIANAPAGSSVGAINPVQPQPDENEIRLMAKRGREITLGVVNGGYVTLGPYGLNLQGVTVLVNGREILASFADKVIG